MKKSGRLPKKISEETSSSRDIRLFGVFVDFFCSEAVYCQNELKG
jgi:hypothetical protein